MEPRHRALLRKFRVQLSEQLLSDAVVPLLFQEGVLTAEQAERLEAEPGSRRRNLQLLDLLPNRGPRAFPAFLEALRDFGWIRDRLLQELQENRAGTGPADDWRLPDSVLQKVPSDRQLSRLASRLGAEWEAVLLDLGVSCEALHRCRSDHSHSSWGAALAGLVLWRRSEGRGATLGRLLRSLEAADVHPSVLEDVVQG